jgi:hypothetical protein
VTNELQVVYGSFILLCNLLTVPRSNVRQKRNGGAAMPRDEILLFVEPALIVPAV